MEGSIPRLSTLNYQLARSALPGSAVFGKLEDDLDTPVRLLARDLGIDGRLIVHVHGPRLHHEIGAAVAERIDLAFIDAHALHQPVLHRVRALLTQALVEIRVAERVRVALDEEPDIRIFLDQLS